MKLKSCSFILVGVLSLALGCSTTRQVKSLPPPLPQPFTISINTSIKIDLPEEMTKETGIPSKILAEVKFSMTSTAIEASPVRSGYLGQFSLLVSDLDQTHSYLDFTSDLNGEYDGRPSECLSLGFNQAFGMMKVLKEASRGMNKGNNR